MHDAWVREVDRGQSGAHRSCVAAAPRRRERADSEERKGG